MVRIDRPISKVNAGPTADRLTAHKLGSIPLDLKLPASVSILHDLLKDADILVDPFRPGVLERLSLSADDLLRQYPRLIIVRLTGFRRDGQWKDRAGHDINYLAVSGVLSLLGAEDRPPSPPANLLADFAGGGLNAFSGALLALLKRGTTGRGSIVDANMVDGSGFLATFARLGKKDSFWGAPRGTNLLDGGCPYYGCYECKDRNRYVAVGALEPQFFDQLLEGLQLKEEDVLGPGVSSRFDREGWPYMRNVFERRFHERTRDEWEMVFQGRDACVTPVKEMEELEAEQWVNRIPVNVRSGSEFSSALGDDVHPSDGVGWSSTGMETGHQAEHVLEQWLGWRRDREWTEDQGVYMKISRTERSKL